MSYFMLHGLGDCRPDHHCGCLTELPKPTPPAPKWPELRVDLKDIDTTVDGEYPIEVEWDDEFCVLIPTKEENR